MDYTSKRVTPNQKRRVTPRLHFNDILCPSYDINNIDDLCPLLQFFFHLSVYWSLVQQNFSNTSFPFTFCIFSLFFVTCLLRHQQITQLAWEISLIEGQSIIFSIGGSSLIQCLKVNVFLSIVFEKLFGFLHGQHLDNNYLSQNIALTSMSNSCSAQTSIHNI